MSAVQLDLLELLDEQSRPPRLTGPGECPACGEPVDDVAGYRASLNHAFDHTGRPTGRDECTSMDLTRNHVVYALQELAHLRAAGNECGLPLWSPCSSHGAQDYRSTLTDAQVVKDRDRLTDMLSRDWARASHVWRNHLDRLHAQITPRLEAAGLTTHDLTKE